MLTAFPIRLGGVRSKKAPGESDPEYWDHRSKHIAHFWWFEACEPGQIIGHVAGRQAPPIAHHSVSAGVGMQSAR
jgi:hypothetical protein